MGRRFRRAAWLSFCFVALLAWIKLFEHWTSEPFSGLALRPHQFAGLVGVLTAPLLHGSLDHLASNSLPLLVLGTLAGTLYPRATLRALPLIWIGSGLGTWFIGEPGSAHIGASGLAHGFLFLVFLLGLIRRDRQAIAGSMLAFFLYGSMVITVFPREYGISWEMHMCGAICGLLAAILWRKLDPPLPRKRYSWEDEPEEPVLEEIPAPGHALPPGTAEEEWVENAIDAGLDWDEDLDDGRAPTRRRRTRPVRPRTLH
jgi:membrane associated rhomboid family serine protease